MGLVIPIGKQPKPAEVQAEDEEEGDEYQLSPQDKFQQEEL